MKFKTSSLALALLAGAVTGVAGAQDKPKTDMPPPKAPAVAATSPGGTARASDLIGKEIVDAADKNIAEIDDLIVGKDGQVCALVDRKEGGLAAIPLDKLQAQLKKQDEPGHTPEVDKLMASDTAKLLSAPALEDRDAISAEWLKSTCDHWKGTGTAATDPAKSERVASAAEKPTCAKKLIGMDLQSSTGDDVGEIQDLAIDLKSGKLAYAVLSVGGVLGVGEKHHGVALEKLTLKGDKYQVPATKDELKDKPGIDLQRLPASPNLPAGK